jgi:hypothetical protein
MLIFNNNKPIKQKQWINTKVEFEWSEELQKYVEQSAEGYWYDGEMALCYTHDHAVSISGNTAIGLEDTAHAALNVSAPSSGTVMRLGNSADSSDDINIYLRSSGLIYFSTAGGGDICLGGGGDPSSFNIKSNDGVGIGTSSPDGKLHVHTATAGSVTASGNADDLVVENSAHGGITILTPDASEGAIYFGTPSDSLGAIMNWAHNDNQMNIGTHNADGFLSFRTDVYSERMRIDKDGNVGIGTSSPGYNLEVAGTFYSAGSSVAYKENL